LSDLQVEKKLVNSYLSIIISKEAEAVKRKRSWFTLCTHGLRLREMINPLL